MGALLLAVLPSSGCCTIGLWGGLCAAPEGDDLVAPRADPGPPPPAPAAPTALVRAGRTGDGVYHVDARFSDGSLRRHAVRTDCWGVVWTRGGALVQRSWPPSLEGRADTAAIETSGPLPGVAVPVADAVDARGVVIWHPREADVAAARAPGLPDLGDPGPDGPTGGLLLQGKDLFLVGPGGRPTSRVGEYLVESPWTPPGPQRVRRGRGAGRIVLGVVLTPFAASLDAVVVAALVATLPVTLPLVKVLAWPHVG